MHDCGGEFHADSRALLARIGEIVGAYDLSQQSRQLSWVQQQLEQGAQRILQESAHEKRMYAALGPLLGMALFILIGYQSDRSTSKMDVDLIFKIAAIGIIVSVLNQVLIRSGREEQATMTTLAGLIVVLMMMIEQISLLFDTVKSVFGL